MAFWKSSITSRSSAFWKSTDQIKSLYFQMFTHPNDDHINCHLTYVIGWGPAFSKFDMAGYKPVTLNRCNNWYARCEKHWCVISAETPAVIFNNNNQIRHVRYLSQAVHNNSITANKHCLFSPNKYWLYFWCFQELPKSDLAAFTLPDSK